MKSLKYMTVLAAFGLVSMSAQAAHLNFNFQGGPTIGNLGEAFNFSVGGVTLSVTASLTDGSAIHVSQNNNAGIGACLTMLDCGRGLADSPQLDSVGEYDEVLTFAISGLAAGEALVLEQFLFAAYNLSNPDRDNFIMTVDGAVLNNGGTFDPSGNAGANPWDVSVDFGTLMATSSFSIRATSHDGFLSSFRITELTAHLAPYTGPPTALSEPGTLGMLLIGLGAAGFIRRRKTA
jgi:hypothetical protein